MLHNHIPFVCYRYRSAPPTPYSSVTISISGNHRAVSQYLQQNNSAISLGVCVFVCVCVCVCARARSLSLSVSCMCARERRKCTHALQPCTCGGHINEHTHPTHICTARLQKKQFFFQKQNPRGGGNIPTLAALGPQRESPQGSPDHRLAALREHPAPRCPT